MATDMDEPRRDIDHDLAEITSRLGDPDAIHRTQAFRVWLRLGLGVLIVLAAAALHYAIWTGQFGAPGLGQLKLWIFLGLTMLVGPGLGLYLIAFAVRGLKLWILIYPSGLFIWHRGRVMAFPWDEVMALQIQGMPSKAPIEIVRDASGVPISGWLDLSRSVSKIFGTTLILTRTDGTQCSLPSTVDQFAELAERVQDMTARRQVPRDLSMLRNGRVVAYGSVMCDAGGLAVGNERLGWIEWSEMVIQSAKLEIRRTGKKPSWSTVDPTHLINVHVLCAVAPAMSEQSIRGEE